MNMIESTPPPCAPMQPPCNPLAAARNACARVAPLWPLQHFVAVNPFVGLTSKPFTEVCDLMRDLVAGGMQMPASYYREKFGRGALTESDLSAALDLAPKVLPADAGQHLRQWTVAKLREELESAADHSQPVLLTVAEAVDQIHGTSWSQAVTEAIGQFCAGYFDAGQSAWRLPWKGLPLYQAWREQASLDADIELHGLPGFRHWVRSLPDDPESLLNELVPLLRIDDDLEDFLHKQLLTVRGWAGHVQHRVREQALHGRTDPTLLHLLAIRVAYDVALLRKHDGASFREFWPAPRGDDALPALARFLWQLADEQAWQRHLFAQLADARQQPHAQASTRPAVQAVFCIDVRSEILRRALESASPEVQTLGFAGFFGLPVEWIPLGQRHGAAQCPVLIAPKYRVREGIRGADEPAQQRALHRIRLGKRIGHSWNAFKTAAISCFSFVETAGLAFGVRLIRDAFAPAAVRAAPACGCGPHLDPDEHGHFGIPLSDRITLAAGALRNMGLPRNFARLVLLCGHGSSTRNNPYAAGLDCGACGGHAGDANARIGAAILNDPEVRAALVAQGIVIPEDTWFLAGLHNTTTDEVTLLDQELAPDSHQRDLAHLTIWLEAAGARARRERARLLGIEAGRGDLDARIFSRSRDWAQVRPEWGLAGNAAFIAAPRDRTRGAELGGRVFLHEYDHRSDADNSTLELIMCAPMVVANWINLQYYASTVNNAVFGSGNKVIHNVIGTLGVCLGNGGDLQTGLPLQSVHDGRRWIHEPLRLHVLLEAPRDRIDAVLAKHEGVRELVDHGWLLLFAIEEDGAAILRRLPGAGWERTSPPSTAIGMPVPGAV